jgi:hypothetical protein
VAPNIFVLHNELASCHPSGVQIFAKIDRPLGTKIIDSGMHKFSKPPQNSRHQVTVNVKFSLEQAMKAQRGSRGIAILFL